MKKLSICIGKKENGTRRNFYNHQKMVKLPVAQKLHSCQNRQFAMRYPAFVSIAVKKNLDWKIF